MSITDHGSIHGHRPWLVEVMSTRPHLLERNLQSRIDNLQADDRMILDIEFSIVAEPETIASVAIVIKHCEMPDG